METKRRLLVCCLLLVVTAGLCVQYAEADLWAAPGTDNLGTDEAAADNQTILVFRMIKSTDVANGELHLIDHSPSRVDIRDIDPAVVERLEPGASIQVYGTVRDQSYIDAETVVVDFANSSDWRYTYGSSILGLLLAAGVFLRFWRLSWRPLGFEPRGDD